jgi:hypothetical protein
MQFPHFRGCKEQVVGLVSSKHREETKDIRWLDQREPLHLNADLLLIRRPNADIRPFSQEPTILPPPHPLNHHKQRARCGGALQIVVVDGRGMQNEVAQGAQGNEAWNEQG